MSPGGSPIANRIRAVEDKVESVRIALAQIDVAAAARAAAVAESSLRYDLNKLQEALPEVLVNHKPGPKAKAKEPENHPPQVEQPLSCPKCEGKVTKNGKYWGLDWVLMLTMGWLGVQPVMVQRWRCTACGHEVASPERRRQAEARQAWWHQVNRLIGLSRFKLRLSVRATQLLVGFVYARPVSIGHIQRVSHQVGQRAENALSKLSHCRQAVAHFLLFDETFPKMKKRTYSLGVGICEYGLIRTVRCITRKRKDICQQLRDVVSEHFQPTYFLTDLDVLYNKCMKQAGLTLIHLRDKVHLIGQIVRLFDEAVRDVSLDVPKGLPFKQRKQQLQLKRRLLTKQLQPLLALVFKAFGPGYESVCVLILTGVISQVQDPTVVIQTDSVLTLARRLQRFVNKHGDSINLLLQLSVQHGTPTTTNSLESKNSILKPFSRIAKFFPAPATCSSFFCGVALMENFDVKTRGLNKGTHAMQRAQINLDDFGATDFFSAVGLSPPQISFSETTY
jgi:hypothetical protein